MRSKRRGSGGGAWRRPGDATKLLPRVNEQDMSVVRRFQNVRSPLRQAHAIVKIALATLQSNEAYARRYAPT